MNEKVVRLQGSNKTFVLNSFYNKDNKFDQKELFGSFMKHMTRFMADRESNKR